MAILSSAPIRICDNGGWTDTWFAGHGEIFNIAVSPRVEVQIDAYPRGERDKQVVIHAENFGDHYARHLHSPWQKHPLLEAAIDRLGVPDDLAVEIRIRSDAPAGASCGTSASVAVALLGALDRLNGGHRSPHEIAELAHSVETEMLHQQSGIQDQLAAAHGGINFIEMDRYPHATVTPISVPDDLWAELDRRLLLIYLGRSHQSSQVHEQVIRGLEDAGPDCEPLQALRATAHASRDALVVRDLAALGRAMIDNTEAQRRLHPALIGEDAHEVIELARAHAALGWKVNGAGGDGGSLTLLCEPHADVRADRRLAPTTTTLLRDIARLNPLFRNIPIRLSREGLTVSESDRG